MTHLQAGLSPETLEKARLELNENPDTLHQDIQEVRDMVITRPDIGFLRTDDAFILRFLRARKFQHFEAFRLLAQYFEYRQQNLDMFKSFKGADVADAALNPDKGWLHSLCWSLCFSTHRAAQVQLEKVGDALCKSKELTHVASIIFFSHVQDSFPARFGGIHFVNQPWYIHALYTVIRPFLKEKTRKRIFLHGNNLNSLHQLIHPEILPSEFGGMLPPYDMGTWARTLLDHEYDDDSECNADSYNQRNSSLCLYGTSCVPCL
uniref:Clavesin-2 n=1 Tax=Pavo cristatus TaxID=9049 RepID=A0A8C9G2X3_PAVCR